MISLHDILNCAQFLKTNYCDLYITLIINDIRNNDIEYILENILDFNFFKNFFDEFKVQVTSFEDFNNYGCVNYKREEYIRIYSGRNDMLTNNIPGIFDVYCDISSIAEIKILKIPFQKFTYDDTVNDVGKFPIFNKKIIDKSDRILCIGYLESVPNEKEIQESLNTIQSVQKYSSMKEYLDIETNIQNEQLTKLSEQDLSDEDLTESED
jgi:hypothetical protein